MSGKLVCNRRDSVPRSDGREEPKRAFLAFLWHSARTYGPQKKKILALRVGMLIFRKAGTSM